MTDNTTKMEVTLKRADISTWLKFTEIFALSLGAGLLLCGIIFFFAFNWQHMHRFVKLGIVAALLIGTFVTVVKVPMRDWVRNTCIFAMCVLVGAFWAVFGQAYQMEADSKIFFLTWSFLIAAWVVAADFHPLWLFFVVLNTFGIQHEEVSLFVLISYTLFFEYSPKIIPHKSVAPKWFMRILFLAIYIISVCIITPRIIDARLTYHDSIQSSNLLLGLAIVANIWTYFYATKKRDISLYSVFFIGLFVETFATIITTLKIDEFLNSLFLYGIFSIVIIYLMSHHILKKKKEWETIGKEEPSEEMSGGPDTATIGKRAEKEQPSEVPTDDQTKMDSDGHEASEEQE